MAIAIIFETIGIWWGLSVGIHILLQDNGATISWEQGILIAALGLWFNRFYLIGHEAVHRKLFPGHPQLNDWVGRLMLLPLAAPLTIYRKIHYFHHGYNRQAPGIATLDSFTFPNKISSWRQTSYAVIWFMAVFCGGFFLHSMVSIGLFLGLPTGLGQRLSPAFNGWTVAARCLAWGELGLSLGFHIGIYHWLGPIEWLYGLGLPFLVFAWIWSLLLYIYHYRTTFGPEVRYNVRSLPPQPGFSWLFLNFNEHVTHHANPQIPWYQLPQERITLPQAFNQNQNVTTLWQAIGQQLQGPMLIENPPSNCHEVEP